MSVVVEYKEFIGQRAQLYGEVLKEFPSARDSEIKVNMGFLNPVQGEKILEIGAGSGLYSRVLADLVGPTGELVATDPSEDQLRNILEFNNPTIRVIKAGADRLLSDPALSKEANSFDAIWSLGAFHHCNDKSQAFSNFFQLLKSNGRIFICDVFSGSSLANYFDAEVARYSITGHEVAFLTKEFTRSLCFLYGFTAPRFHDLNYYWNFKSKEELGLFMYKLHGMAKTTPEECLKKVEEFMEIEKMGNTYSLKVPLTIVETYKP